MPARRGWKQPKQDHSVYVQQLFKDFLTRNTEKPADIADTDTRTNFFQRDSTAAVQRKQPGIFDRAVYARFERDTHNGGFMRQEPVAGLKTGLMKWIDHQRNHRTHQNVLHKTTRSDDYLNLPGNFFSGSDQMQLPFDAADKTIGNVTNNFVPPAASTPFDRLSSFGISGVLSDPEEFQSNTPNTSPCDENTTEWKAFLNSVEEYLISIHQDGNPASILEQQRKELEVLPVSTETEQPIPIINRPELTEPQTALIPSKHFSERPSWKDHSLISNQNYFLDGKCNSATTLDAPDPCPSNPDKNDEMIVQTTKKRNNVTFLIETFSQTIHEDDTTQEEILLTASPPSPTLSSRRRHGLYEENTFLLPDHMSTDDTLMQKLDALLDDDDFNGMQKGFIGDFDFTSPANQTMNVTFPTHFQISEDTLEDSMLNVDIAETPLHLSQDMLSATTLSVIREPFF